MLKIAKDNVYASFISAGTEEFKAGYVQNSFDLVREYIAARLAKGYEANYLGTLNLNGYAVFRGNSPIRMVAMIVWSV